MTIDGELAEIRIIEQKKAFDRAELLKVLRSSAQRVEPLCPYFGRCGGCDYQHIAYEHQLQIKRGQVAELLKRIGLLQEVQVSPVVASPHPYAFRNRITVHAERGRLGFFEKNSRRVVDIERCEIAVPEVNERLGQLRSAGLREGSHRTLRKDPARQTFTQTNDFVATEMLAYVSKQLTGRVLLDAYCGSGFFGHALADRLEKVVGVDWNRRAIAAAAAIAGSNERYLCADVSESIQTVFAQDNPDIVIADPPAQGLEDRVVKALLENRPQRVIYISCNPATFARDAALLRASFELQSVQPFDMFPQTAEIEIVAILDLASSVRPAAPLASRNSLGPC